VSLLPAPDPQASLGEWAQYYATLGWPVFPLAPNSKRPLIPKIQGGNGFLDATTDSDQIDVWWSECPDAGIGMPTGVLSDTGILDVDIKEWEGKRGDQTLIMLEAEHSPLPTTVKMWTWSGGCQYFFRHHPDIVNRAGAFGQWLDSRSEGGYTILPPSRITEAGRTGMYHWDGDPTKPRAVMPEWLVALHKQIVQTNGHRPANSETNDGIKNGVRNDTLYRIGRSLHFKGLVADAIRPALASINATACRPPVSDDELEQIIRNVVTQPDRKGYEPRVASASVGASSEVSDDSFPDPGADDADNSDAGTEVTSPIRAPQHAMLGVGRDFADLYHRAYGGPKEYWFWSFMTCYAAHLDGLVQHISESRPRTRMYTVKAGETGIGKSASSGQAVAFFEQHVDWPLKILNGAGSGEGVAKAVEKAPGNKILIHLDELATMVTKSQQGTGSTLPPVLTSLFENNQYSNSALQTPIEIANASVSILAGCTTDTYSTLFAAGYVNLGFLPRLFLVAGEERMKPEADRVHPSIEDRQALASKVLDSLNRAVDGRKDHSTGARVYAMTEEARAIQRAWGARYPESLAPEHVRLGAYGQRLMLILAAGCGKSEIDAEIAQATADWLAYEAEVRGALRPIVADSPWAEMEQKIIRALSRGELPTQAVKKACHYERAGLKVWTSAVEMLERGGLIRMFDKNTTAGRSVERMTLTEEGQQHPAARKGTAP